MKQFLYTFIWIRQRFSVQCELLCAVITSESSLSYTCFTWIYYYIIFTFFFSLVPFEKIFSIYSCNSDSSCSLISHLKWKITYITAKWMWLECRHYMVIVFYCLFLLNNALGILHTMIHLMSARTISIVAFYILFKWYHECEYLLEHTLWISHTKMCL